MVAESEPLVFCFRLGKGDRDVRAKESLVIEESAEAFRTVVGEKVVRTTGIRFPDDFAASLLTQVL